MRNGSRTARAGDDFRLPDAICRACRNLVYLVGGNPERALHFRHRTGSTCPTMSVTGEPYLRMSPINGDVRSGAVLRKAVRVNWKAHYSAITDMVPFLSPEEFVLLLNLACERRTWDYRGLTEIHIPSVLVLMADFPPWASTRRRRDT